MKRLLVKDVDAIYAWKGEVCTEFVTITPSSAKALLELNTKNRTLSPIRVQEYAEIMRTGLWVFNGDTVRVDRNGVLLDGQHRLSACVTSGMNIDAVLVYGLPAEVMPTIDTGTKRTLSSVLQIEGEANTGATATAIRWSYVIRQAYMRAAETGEKVAIFSKKGPEHQEALAYLEEHRPQIEEAARLAPKIRKLIGIAGPVLGVFVLLLETNPEKARVFFHQLASGESLTASDPAFILRERFIELRGKQAIPHDEVIAAWVIVTWNSFRAGRKRSIVKWAEEHGFPVPEK